MHKRHSGLELILPQSGKIAQQSKACEHPFVIHDTTGERTDVKVQTKNLRCLVRRLLQHEKGRFKSLRVIQEISRRLDEALRHHFQIMIAAQPCLTETLGKILGKGGEKDVEQNVAENDGFGKTIVGEAQSNVRHHAQARFTEYLIKEGEHKPKPRRGVQRHDFCATTVRADSQPHRGNVDIRHHVPEFVGSLRPEQTRLFFMCLQWKSWRKDDHETTEQWRNRCSFAENILDEEFVLCAFAPNCRSKSTTGSGTVETAEPQACEGQSISSVSHMNARQKLKSSDCFVIVCHLHGPQEKYLVSVGSH